MNLEWGERVRREAAGIAMSVLEDIVCIRLHMLLAFRVVALVGIV